jgi:hypothetical protein
LPYCLKAETYHAILPFDTLGTKIPDQHVEFLD